jgi:hypothetical protein
MHKNATKYNKTQSKWCINRHGASKIIDSFETYQSSISSRSTFLPSTLLARNSFSRKAPVLATKVLPSAGWLKVYPRVSLGYPTKMHFSALVSSLLGYNFFTYASQPQTLSNDNLGFFPCHSSYGVVSTDLDDALLRMNAAVSNA